MLRWVHLAGALALGLAMQAGHAQYPVKPIRIVVPFPAGGSTDIAARVLAHSMGQSLGQTVLIDYRPGGDGVIAGEYVARSAPDGYTFLIATPSALNYAPVTRKTMPYDAINDFTPVGRIGYFGFFLFVHEAVPVKAIGELVTYAKSNPGKLNYGTSNATSMVATMQFSQDVKVNMTHIPYKGEAPLITDLLSGRIQVSFAAGATLAHAKDGKLRVLATMLPNRSLLAPNAPTLAESGVHNVSVTPWAGLFGPAKLPRDVVERVSRALAKALAQEDIREQLGKLAVEASASTPEELSAMVKEQLDIWRKAVQAAGIQPE